MDERKKKMLMIGGVVALAVVIIIAAAVMMDHKKKVEQSPMIVHTTTGAIIVPANTPVSTLPTTATTTIPGTTRAVTTQGVTTTIPVTTRAVTTQGVTTTIPVTTRAVTTQGVTTTIPVSTKPALTYIQSTGGLYLICEFGKSIATTKVLSEATPVTFSKCPSDVEGTKFEYCLMSGNQNVKISAGGAISTDGTYTIYIHSLSEKTYLGLVSTDAYLDGATLGFTSSISPSDASIWNVVTM
jgi:cytoskeletal protein RodZ